MISQRAAPTHDKTGQQASGTSPLTLSASPGFTTWLAEQRLSLAFTTYQAGKLFLIGLQPDGRLSVAERNYKRCMGLCAYGDGLWMSTLTQLWRFDNTLQPGQEYQGYDKLYVPRLAYTTGDLDLHDMAVTRYGELVFVNTGYLRGMSFSGDYAIIGLSRPRHDHTYSGLPLDHALAQHKSTARCGLQVINLNSGKPEHHLNIEGVVEELYDVIALPSVHKPLALGFRGDELRRLITVGPERGLM